MRMQMLRTLGALVVTRAHPRTCRRLDYNLITSIDSGAFTGLSSVTTLYVATRSLICGWLFVRMQMLGTLGALVVKRARPRACRYLDNNKITSIDSGTFTGLSSVTTLYVATRSFVGGFLCG